MPAAVPRNRLFYKDRFTPNLSETIPVLLYSFIGIPLAIIRTFMLVEVFEASRLLQYVHELIRRWTLRVFCCALGIVIQEDESECQRDRTCRLLLSNHISLFDHIAVHLLTNCETLVACNASARLLSALCIRNVAKKSDSIPEVNNFNKAVLRTALMAQTNPILIFPENNTTNGEVGLLKFSSWWASEVNSVQPIALQLIRPLNIKASILESTWYTDCFWFFFIPFTIYKVKYLSPVEREENESEERFANRIQYIIAKNLGITNTEYTGWNEKDGILYYHNAKNIKFSIVLPLTYAHWRRITIPLPVI